MAIVPVGNKNNGLMKLILQGNRKTASMIITQILNNCARIQVVPTNKVVSLEKVLVVKTSVSPLT